MPTVTKKTRLTDINPQKLTEELVAALSVPLIGVGYHGFVRESRRLFKVATSQINVTHREDPSGIFDDNAEIGEMRLHTDVVLSTADNTAADTTISSHNETQLTREQSREDKDTAQLSTAANKLKRANWVPLSNADRMEALRRNLMLLHRDNQFTDFDTDD